jgi:hypothetical protein
MLGVGASESRYMRLKWWGCKGCGFRPATVVSDESIRANVQFDLTLHLQVYAIPVNPLIGVLVIPNWKYFEGSMY